MTIKKKIGIAIIAILMLVFVGSFSLWISDEDRTSKEITIQIYQEKELIFDETVKLEASTLEEALKEIEELKVKTEDGDYGVLLTSLMDLDQNMQSGPWWLFSSENNEDCLAQGMCPSLGEVHLKDKDKFTFTYTKNISF